MAIKMAACTSFGSCNLPSRIRRLCHALRLVCGFSEIATFLPMLSRSGHDLPSYEARCYDASMRGNLLTIFVTAQRTWKTLYRDTKVHSNTATVIQRFA